MPYTVVVHNFRGPKPLRILTSWLSARFPSIWLRCRSQRTVVWFISQDVIVGNRKYSVSGSNVIIAVGREESDLTIFPIIRPFVRGMIVVGYKRKGHIIWWCFCYKTLTLPRVSEPLDVVCRFKCETFVVIVNYIEDHILYQQAPMMLPSRRLHPPRDLHLR